ncbi:putative cytochrome P450 [Tanacetum coccineum]
MREGRLRWFGHVKRRPHTAPVRRVEALLVDGLRRRGRPKLRWEDRLKQDMKELLLSGDMTSYRSAWREGDDDDDLYCCVFVSQGLHTPVFWQGNHKFTMVAATASVSCGSRNSGSEPKQYDYISSVLRELPYAFGAAYAFGRNGRAAEICIRHGIWKVRDRASKHYWKVSGCQGEEASSIWPNDGMLRSSASESIMRCLSRMLHESIGPDVTVNTCVGTLKAHKAILSSSSHVFNSRASESILRCLSRMLHDSIDADVTINIREGTLKAHKAILSASSPVFHSRG